MNNNETKDNPAPGEKTGRAMLYAGWLLALGILTLVFGQWENKQINPNSDPSSTENSSFREVSLIQNRYNHYVLDGFINNRPVTFLLDTGASDVVIPETIARKLSLQKGPRVPVQTANGTIDVYLTHLDRLQIGTIILHDIDAAINPAMNSSEEILLGMSALKDLEITQQDRKLTLRQSLH